MDKLTRQEYQLYADDADIPYARKFVRAFYEICREFPVANARTFHQVLKLVAGEQRMLEAAKASSSGDVILDFPSLLNADEEDDDYTEKTWLLMGMK